MSVKSAKSAHFLEENSSKFDSMGLLKVKGLKGRWKMRPNESHIVIGVMPYIGRPGFELVTVNPMPLSAKHTHRC